MAKWPHEEVSENSKLYPETLLRVKVMKQEDGEDDEGRFFVAVHARIVEPPSLKNQNYDFRFLIGINAKTAEKLGIEEDLEAAEEATWTGNPSARRYKSYLVAAGVAVTGDTEEEAEDVKGKVLLIQNANRDGKYNDASAFYPDGEAPASKADMNGLKRTNTSKTVAAKSKTPPPAKEEENDENWDE